MLSKDIKNKIKDVADSTSSLISSINKYKSTTKDKCINEKGVKDKHNYIYKFKGAVTTEYYCEEGGSNTGCLGTKLTENYSVASHNIPCGTKIYIPDFKGVLNSTGIFEVEDTGGNAFDFDMFISNNKIGKVGKTNHDVYVLSWGNKKVTCSYTYITEYYIKKKIINKYIKATKNYSAMGGVLINFYMFNDEDKDIKGKTWYSNIF